MVWATSGSLQDDQATYFIHARLGLPQPMLPEGTSCHPRCKTAGPSQEKTEQLQDALQRGWHQFQCRVGGHRIRSHNDMMGGVIYYATDDGNYSCETTRHLHTGGMGGDQIDGLLTNWRQHEKVLAVDLTLSNIFAPTYLPGAARCAYKIISKRAKHKYQHHREAVEAQGRTFMPWVHTIMGDTGPSEYTCFQAKIYKRLAKSLMAKHMPPWSAQRRQQVAHAHVQAVLYRNSMTGLDQLSINPAAKAKHHGSRQRYAPRRNFARDR